ncbi:GPI-anchored wall transfer protein 1, putative [Plasmodium gallinaceum]|uniref:GPI-anchored wall transfer protein 1, putative n=1 Tax=Plasmodium gallinaceum TaxID=5849 RepID=A0A1J1GMS7_PLAGA|nr:GPI-anchored wall transfer protein 1, putative [Plasmodium gallinaceum]CRG93734.1 GPI-anchored wall transfer protein 1, putative [Plasmodium gallinaceum]
MTNINIFVYLFICPLNVLYILDMPCYFHDVNMKIQNKNLFIYGDKTKNGKYSLHYEEYLYEISKVYYNIILKNNKEIRNTQSNNYDLIWNNNNSSNNGYQLKEVHIKEDKMHLFYEKEANKVEIIVNKINDVTNYFDLFKNWCIYKLNDKDYTLLKNSTDNSKELIINSYYIYMYLMFFSLCIYLEKGLFITFPSLRKYELIITIFIVFIPLIFFLFFYFYFSALKILTTYIVLYISFFAFYLKKEKIKIKDIYFKKMKDTKNNKYCYKSLTNFRLMNMCATYMCIFAVDFFFFPKHFAKSAYYGNTLMDIGIGTCIISSAYSFKKTKFEYIRDHKKIIELKNIILFILGISRLIAIRIFNYKYNLTEYGVDWNFFLTLFSTFVISNFFFVILKKIRNIFVFSCISIFLYELFIYYFNIHDYLLLESERTNIFSSNKEGLFNIIGSVNLFLFSFIIGQYILNDTIPESVDESKCNIYKGEEKKKQLNLENTKKENIQFKYYHPFLYTIFNLLNNIYSFKKKYYNIYFNIKLFLMSFLFYSFHFILNSFEIYSVRILCNANYIFITSSVCLFAIAMGYLLEILLIENMNINILDKLNSITLEIFLFCNILVGIFNIFLKPLLYPLIFGIIILILYTYLFMIFTYYLPLYPKKKKIMNNKQE